MKKILLFFLIFTNLNCNIIASNDIKNVQNKSKNQIFTQLNLYMKSSYEGDYKLFEKYNYYLLYDYLVKTDPKNYHSRNDVLNHYKLILNETKQAINNRKIKVNYKIIGITKTFETKTNLISIVKVKSTIIENNKPFEIIDDVFSISNDKGNNWQFLIKDKELLPKVLKLKFDNKLINKILK